MIKQSHIRRLIALGFCLMMLLTGCSLFSQDEQERDPLPPLISSGSEDPALPDPVTVNLRAVGDNLIHDVIYQQAARRTNSEGYDFLPAYEYVAPLLADNDFMCINQETILAGSIAPLSNYPQFNSPMELGDQLVDLGFNVVSHANNHMFDVGEDGLRTAVNFWKSKSTDGVLLTGAYLDEEDLHTPKTKTVNDVTLAFIGATQHTNGLSLPAGSDMRYVHTDERELMAQLVSEAKAVSDLVVVAVHWGNEGTHQPTQYQYDYARYLAELGVDIVWGHHSHTLQPMEWIDQDNGSGERTFVAYSLGNFISAQSSNYNMPGGMVDLSITKNYETGKTIVEQATFIPTVTHYGANMSNVTIYPLSAYSPELASQHGVQAFTPFSYDYVLDTVRQVIDEEFYTPELATLLAQ